jgi:hypothetical protein
MFKRFVTVWGLVVFLAAGAAAAEESVFRGLNWGDPVESLGRHNRIQGMDGDAYTKHRDHMDMGAFRAERIVYGFTPDDRLYMITVTFPHRDMAAAIRMLDARYGKGREFGTMEKWSHGLGVSDTMFEWKSGDTYIALFHYHGETNATIGFVSESLRKEASRQREAIRQEEAQRHSRSW